MVPQGTPSGVAQRSCLVGDPCLQLLLELRKVGTMAPSLDRGSYFGLAGESTFLKTPFNLRSHLCLMLYFMTAVISTLV